MVIFLAPLVSLIGLLIYAFAGARSKPERIGFAMFVCGLLAFLLTFHGAPGLAAQGAYHFP